MIDHDERPLAIKRQAKVLSISRATAYYKPRPVSEEDLLWMRRLDELRRCGPFARWHADEEDGHRGDLSQAEHLQARAGPPDLPISSAERSPIRSGRWTSATSR